MKNTLIIGLGIQGNKRKKVLNKMGVNVVTVDPYNDKANYKSVKDLNFNYIIQQ